ncbi:uncharacterized protein LOC131220827 [Magnolia sinica]|uniref:uncharacterized protein LOC131220827 n=1 Tax=Magnolia sinica TaxID=86752 RepID=UPI00265AC6D2|nr:uncharacterized protein LOC131220827 [Magnolia sinica]
MMPGVLAVVNLNIRDAAVFLILCSANEFVADLPGGLLRHQFPSMANYTIFILGILLLYLSFLFPRESVSQVAKKLFCIAAEHCRLSLDAAARATSLVGEKACMILAQMKEMFMMILVKMKKRFKVLVLVTTVAVFGIVVDLAYRLPHRFLSVAYVLTNFATLTLGISLLLLSIVFTRVPVSVVLAKKLVSATARLGRFLLGLRRKRKFGTMRSAGSAPLVIKIAEEELAWKMFKMSVLTIFIAAFGIYADLSIPHHKFLSIAYVVAIFLAMAVSLHYILFLWVPVSVNVAKKLVWVAVGLVHLSVGLRLAIHVYSPPALV